MATMTCIRCDEEFDVPFDRPRCYCDACVEAHYQRREQIAEKQNPAPGVHCDGTFAKTIECPQSFYDEDNHTVHCGLCGSDETEQGYGLAGGYGCGSYRFCSECYAIMDFVEDSE